MRGPHMRTIMQLMRTPTSVDTKASALRMSVAPIVASRIPIQCIARSPVPRSQGRRLSRDAHVRNPPSPHIPRISMRTPSAARMLLVPTLLFTLLGRLEAQDSARAAGHDHADHDVAVPGGGTIPAGWSVRPDRGASTANVKLAPMGT